MGKEEFDKLIDFYENCQPHPAPDRLREEVIRIIYGGIIPESDHFPGCEQDRLDAYRKADKIHILYLQAGFRSPGRIRDIIEAVRKEERREAMEEIQRQFPFIWQGSNMEAWQALKSENNG